jgi:hypothetical protein
MPDRVDPAMDPVEASPRDFAGDVRPREPKARQLAGRYDPVLTSRQVSHAMVSSHSVNHALTKCELSSVRPLERRKRLGNAEVAGTFRGTSVRLRRIGPSGRF